jgi:hypothetical protein
MKSDLLKKLLSDDIRAIAGRGALGAGAGAYLGHEVTPQLFGYEDDEAAKNMSTLLDAALYGTLGGLGPKGVGKLMKKSPVGFAGSVAGGELLPVGMHGAQEGIKAMGAGTRAMDEFNPPTASEQMASILGSPESRGAMGGAAVAGIGSLLSGLLRSKSEKERQEDKSRGGMVTNDFLKYLLPAMVAGGVLGNVAKGDQPPKQV